MERVGSRDSIIPRMNLTLTLIQCEHYEQALEEVRLLLPATRAHFGPEPQAVALGLALPCLADQEATESWDEIFGSMLRKLELFGAHDPDIAWVLERSGDLWASASDSGRAAKAWAVAEAQWTKLENRPV